MTTQDTGTSHRASTTDPVLPSATTLAKGLAVLRIFFGIVLFANGIAKLFEFRRIEVGPYIANLIDKGSARSILANGFDEGDQERSIPGLRPLDAGELSNATPIEAFTAVLLQLNVRYKTRVAPKLTGIKRDPALPVT